MPIVSEWKLITKLNSPISRLGFHLLIHTNTHFQQKPREALYSQRACPKHNHKKNIIVVTGFHYYWHPPHSVFFCLFGNTITIITNTYDWWTSAGMVWQCSDQAHTYTHTLRERESVPPERPEMDFFLYIVHERHTTAPSLRFRQCGIQPARCWCMDHNNIYRESCVCVFVCDCRALCLMNG